MLLNCHRSDLIMTGYDLLNYIWTFIVNYAYPLLISVVLFLIVFFTLRFIVKSRMRDEILKESMLIILRGPLAVAVIGYGFYYFIEHYGSLITQYTQQYRINVITLEFIIELIFLVVSINAARKIGKLILKKFQQLGPRQERFLLIGIYTLGLMVFVYILLTSPLSPAIYNFIYPVANFFTGIVITYLIVYTINLLIVRYQTAIRGKQPQIDTTLTFLRRIIIGLIAVVGSAIAAFSSFPGASSSVASLFVAAGFTSIVIGLAAQSSISNLIAGGVIAFAQPFRVNDAVIFNNEYCFVEDIKLLFSVLRTWDNRRLMVPNSKFLDSVLINYTAVDPSKLAIVYVTVTFESDLDKAYEVMLKAAREHPLFYPADGLPSVQIMEFSDYGVNLRLLSRASNQGNNWNMEKELLFIIKREFEKNGIRLSVPRREVVFPGSTGPFGPSMPRGSDSTHEKGKENSGSPDTPKS